MGYSKSQAAKLAGQIFRDFDKQILEATIGTVVPPKFIAGLIGNEAGKFKDGTINRAATRFEPGVYKHLIAVRDGSQKSYSGIVRGDIRDASDAAIRALATSYEATQIMGYHCIHTLHCTLADLRNPDKHFHYTVKMLLANGFPQGADNERMANEMRQWNTGGEHGKTYHADYVANAKAVRDAYAELEKTRLHRTVAERVAGVAEEEAPAPVSESISLAGTCPNCGADNQGGRFADSLCPECGDEVDKAEAGMRAGNKETPTGEQLGGEPPRIEVQPTKLKGYIAALLGFIVTNITAAGSWFANLPPVVIAGIFIGGGLATASLVIGVIWIKNQREERAAQKELALISSKGNAQIQTT